jgi:hypothetical protein
MLPEDSTPVILWIDWPPLDAARVASDQQDRAHSHLGSEARARLRRTRPRHARRAHEQRFLEFPLGRVLITSKPKIARQHAREPPSSGRAGRRADRSRTRPRARRRRRAWRDAAHRPTLARDDRRPRARGGRPGAGRAKADRGAGAHAGRSWPADRAGGRSRALPEEPADQIRYLGAAHRRRGPGGARIHAGQFRRSRALQGNPRQTRAWLGGAPRHAGGRAQQVHQTRPARAREGRAQRDSPAQANPQILLSSEGSVEVLGAPEGASTSR